MARILVGRGFGHHRATGRFAVAESMIRFILSADTAWCSGASRVLGMSRTSRMPTSQWWLIVAVVAASLIALFVSWGLQLERGLPEPANTMWMLADPVLGVVAIVLLPKVLYRDSGDPDWRVDPRRERRGLVWGVVIVLCATVSGAALPSAAVAVVSLAGRRRAASIAAGASSFMIASVAGLILDREPVPWGEMLIASGLVCAVLVMYGLYRGGRRALLRSLRQEAEAARRSQEAREFQARQEERTEIAREMHDSVSHRLALVALHAGALEYRDDLEPEKVREAAAVIRQAAQEAADELRATLHVLRADGSETRPAPTLADLTRLVDAVRAAGMPVSLDLQVPDGVVLPDATAAHAYRVLQESLTNASKHAPGQRVDVLLAATPGQDVQVRVANLLAPQAPRGPGSRVGLVGLRERMTLVGGRFEAGMRGGRFVVEAWVPWRT